MLTPCPLRPCIVDRGRQLHLEPVQLLAERDLAAQARRVLQLVGQVEHVHFLVARLLRQFIVVGWLEDQVTRRTGECALAGPESVQVDVVVHDHVEQRLAHLPFGLYPLPIRTQECDGDPRMASEGAVSRCRARKITDSDYFLLCTTRTG